MLRVFTTRYALSPYITQIRFVYKKLKYAENFELLAMMTTVG
jgi:hypothetical protein